MADGITEQSLGGLKHTQYTIFLLSFNLDHIKENLFTGVLFSIAILGHLIQRPLEMEGLMTGR